MQAETGQIGNGLKLTKKAKYDFESFTSHAHAKITKKQLENTYKSYCLPLKKNIRVFLPTYGGGIQQLRGPNVTQF